MRTFWRIIRMKDRGVEHNFKVDKMDPKTNILVYKAEVNRICSLGGIVFPLIQLSLFISVLIYQSLNPIPAEDIDPHLKESFFEKHIIKFLIILSLIHISLSKRYVLRIYFNKKSNVFSVSTWRWYIPGQTKTFECKPGAAVKNRWNESNDVIQTFIGNTKILNKNYFINEEHFTFPVFYNVFFGFSSPQVLNQIGLQSESNLNKEAEHVIKARNKDISTHF